MGTWGWILKALTGLLTTTRLERRREYAEEARDERSEYCVMCKANHAIAHLESLTDIAKKEHYTLRNSGSHQGGYLCSRNPTPGAARG